jgi:lupus La protein
MRRFQPFEAIVAALKDSEFLEVIEDDKIRRKVPLPSDVWQGTMKDSQKFFEDKTLDRSIYAVSFACLRTFDCLD